MPLEDSKEAQVQSYGTLERETSPEYTHGWLQRAHVPGLMQDLAVLYGATGGLLLYMVITSLFGGLSVDRHFSCVIGPQNKVIKTHIGSAICEYTGIYVWSFPQIAVASMMLLIGRDLAQKRFYYFLLKNGGVMNFLAFPVLQDWVVRANLWAFGHFWIFVGLVLLRLYVNQADPHIAFEEATRAAVAAASNPNDHTIEYDADHLSNSGDPKGLQLLIELLVLLGIPGVLFLARLFTAYHIEKQLVPLSEYVRDSSPDVLHTRPSEDLQEEADHPHATKDASGHLQSINLMTASLGKLLAIKDNCTSALLQKHLENILEQRESADERYKNVLDLYVKEGWYKLHQEPVSIELLYGLWPAPFVLAPPQPPTTHEAFNMLGISTGFPYAWNIYRRMSLLICGSILFIQIVAMLLDIVRIFAVHPESGFALLGGCFNIYVVGTICQQIYLAHAPVEKATSDQKNPAA